MALTTALITRRQAQTLADLLKDEADADSQLATLVFHADGSIAASFVVDNFEDETATRRVEMDGRYRVQGGEYVA